MNIEETEKFEYAANSFWTALSATDIAHSAEGNWVDGTGGSIIGALLDAGWNPPVPPGHICEPKGDPLKTGRWTCPIDGVEWIVVKRMVGRQMHGQWVRRVRV